MPGIYFVSSSWGPVKKWFMISRWQIRNLTYRGSRCPQLLGKYAAEQGWWQPHNCQARAPSRQIQHSAVLDANTKIFVASFSFHEILGSELMPKQPCVATSLHISCLFSLVLLSIHQLLISLLPSWNSRLPSAWNRIPGWRIGVGQRVTLGPDNS